MSIFEKYEWLTFPSVWEQIKCKSTIDVYWNSLTEEEKLKLIHANAYESAYEAVKQSAYEAAYKDVNKTIPRY